MRIKYSIRAMLAWVLGIAALIVGYQVCADGYVRYREGTDYTLLVIGAKLSNGDELEAVSPYLSRRATFVRWEVQAPDAFDDGIAVHKLIPGDVVLHSFAPRGVRLVGRQLNFVFRDGQLINHPRDVYRRILRHPFDAAWRSRQAGLVYEFAVHGRDIHGPYTGTALTLSMLFIFRRRLQRVLRGVRSSEPSDVPDTPAE